MRARLKDWLLPPMILLCSACATQEGAEGSSQQASPQGRATGLRTSEEVARALERAQAAFLAGSWGEAVVLANRVLEGAASADEYYAAVKILGLASCARKDPRPVAFAWKRLLPADRESLKNQCETSGLRIDDGGQVRPAP
jgi:hypothetical protein